MPKVSINKLNPRVYEKLFSLLPEMISACSNAKEADSMTNALFSNSEKTMIAKRIAILLMLAKKQKYSSISAKLKVSQGTIAKMAESVTTANRTFLTEFEKVAKSDVASDFWTALGYKLETLLPPKGGNWSEWRSRKIKEKIANEQPF